MTAPDRPENDDRDWLHQAQDRQAEAKRNLMTRLFGPAEDDDPSATAGPDVADPEPDDGPDAA